jgi:hypothetical protein
LVRITSVSDGHRARLHLVERLAFRAVPFVDSGIKDNFLHWMKMREPSVGLRKPVTVLLPPILMKPTRCEWTPTMTFRISLFIFVGTALSAVSARAQTVSPPNTTVFLKTRIVSIL